MCAFDKGFGTCNKEPNSVSFNYYPKGGNIELQQHVDSVTYGTVIILLKGKSKTNGLKLELAGQHKGHFVLPKIREGQMLTILKGVNHKVTWIDEPEDRYTLTFTY